MRTIMPIGHLQSEILGVVPKVYSPSDPGISCFIENPLEFDTAFKPGLELFTGQISSALGACLIGATGKLRTSPTFMKLAMQEAGAGAIMLDNHLRTEIIMSLKQFKKDGIVASIPNQSILNGYGQVFPGDFWQVNPSINGPLIKGVMAYTRAFDDLSSSGDIEAWAIATGLKVKNTANTRMVLEILRVFGDNPDQEINLSTGQGRVKDTNPLYSAVRRLTEAGLVRAVDSGRGISTVKSEAGRVRRLANRIKEYDTQLSQISDAECEALVDIAPYSCLGIKEGRWNLIRSAVGIYAGLRAQNNQNKSQT